MNPYVVMSLAYMYSATNEDAEPVVLRYDCEGRYTLTDGRHRVVAAMMVGRKNILAIVEE